MKKAAAVISFIMVLVVAMGAQAQAAENPCGDFDPAWEDCQQDSDCVPGNNECGFPASYNQQSLDAATKYAACMAPMIKCASGNNMNLPSGAPVCRMNKCARSDDADNKAASMNKINHPCGDSSPAWQFCQQDSDCAAGHDECRFPAAYNKQFFPLATKYADCLAPMVNCASQADVNPPSGPPVCREQKCVRAGTEIQTATTCRAAVAALEDFFKSQPNSCHVNEDCDGYFFRADSCVPAVVLAKAAITDSFNAELLQNQATVRSACADQWKNENRPACSPIPFSAACENGTCVDKAPPH